MILDGNCEHIPKFVKVLYRMS